MLFFWLVVVNTCLYSVLWFVGWYPASHRSTLCRGHFAFRTLGHGSRETVGQLGGQGVGGGSKATAFNNHDWSWNQIEGSARQCRAEMVGLHGNCAHIGTKNFWTSNSTSSKRQRRIMPTNGFWKTGGFPFLSVFTILKLLFHWLCALQVGIVPCTKNAYRVWTFTFANADPLWALRTLTRHLNGMRFCKLGPNEPRVLLASRRYRVGPEFVVVRIGNWPLTLTNFLFHHWIQTISHSQPAGRRRLGRPKHRWDSKLEDTVHDYELWEQHLNGFLDFACNVCIKSSAGSPRGVPAWLTVAQYISFSDDQWWVKRFTPWRPDVREQGIRPPQLWHTFDTIFSRRQGLED